MFRKSEIFINIGTSETPIVSTVNGYEFECVLSTGDVHPLTVYKNGKVWVVCDYNTGCVICYSNTRANAVQKFLDSYRSRLERLVFENSPTHSFENSYERMVRIFGEAVEDFERNMV